MTNTGLALGTLALATDPALRNELRTGGARRADVGLGLASAVALYGIFQVGDRLARRLMPRGAEQIDEVYLLRRLRPRTELAARMALVIGPAEELFWRGLVQRGMSERFGRWPGAALAAASYGAVHLVTQNLTLSGAAVVAGAFWSALAAAGAPMTALIVSHVAWDVWIFLVAPTAIPGVA
jgi:membrane protease YdiL (CAAX protease family)